MPFTEAKDQLTGELVFLDAQIVLADDQSWRNWLVDLRARLRLWMANQVMQ